MAAVFDAQYLNMKAAFASEGIDIQVAYTPAGEVDYIYQAGQLLALDTPATFEALEAILPRRLRRADPDTEPGSGAPVVLSIGEVEGDYLTVPDALDRIDHELGDDNPALLEDGVPLVTPVHILHITRLCPATEPVVPSGYPTEPWPGPCPPGEPQADVRIGVSDTGLLKPLNPAWSWLAGVDGDPDHMGPVLASGLPLIPEYTGHGTFVAGVARCMAPTAGVYVNDHFWLSGGAREDVIIQKLEQLIQGYSPHVVNLSAGTYTRNNWTPLSFFYFHQQHEELTLVAAAGNDATDRPFYPAALSWPIAVGALGTDQQHRAWFSNFGDWVNVYALGEGLVNAYATGEYIYQEPPKRPARQTFNGMANWSGTSFSTPLVAGLIAAEIARTGASPAAAAGTVLAAAQELDCVGPALFPCDVP
jgi:subtilisin family serine protease